MAKKSKDEVKWLERGAGVVLGLANKVVPLALRRGLGVGDFHWLTTPDGDETLGQMLDLMAAARHPAQQDQPATPAILERFPNARIEREFELTVDRTGAPADLLLATGCDYIYEWMKSHHPAWKGSGVTTEKAVVIDMGSDYKRDDALAVIDALGLARCPDSATLWTLSKTHPDLQRDIGIMDPETVWLVRRGDSCVAILGGNSDSRYASLIRVEDRWDRDYRVLALRK